MQSLIADVATNSVQQLQAKHLLQQQQQQKGEQQQEVKA